MKKSMNELEIMGLEFLKKKKDEKFKSVGTEA